MLFTSMIYNLKGSIRDVHKNIKTVNQRYELKCLDYDFGK